MTIHNLEIFNYFYTFNLRQTKEEKDKFIPPITSIIQAMKTQETPMLTS